MTISLKTVKENTLAERMIRLGVLEKDLVETFACSGGPGGQNVNKTATCVLLLHKPTGLQVKCQTTRQQGLNRALALKLLLDKLEARRQARLDAERDRVEKTRRQTRGRSRASKKRMMADKSRHASKKKMRGRPSEE